MVPLLGNPLAAQLIMMGAQEFLRVSRDRMARAQDPRVVDALMTEVAAVGETVNAAAREWRASYLKQLQEAQDAQKVPAENSSEDVDDGSGGTGEPEEVPELRED